MFWKDEMLTSVWWTEGHVLLVTSAMVVCVLRIRIADPPLSSYIRDRGVSALTRLNRERARLSLNSERIPPFTARRMSLISEDLAMVCLTYLYLLCVHGTI